MRSRVSVLGCLDAVDLRHPDVHDDQIGLELAGKVDRLPAVSGFGDDFVAKMGQHLAQVETDQRLIVGNR